MIGTYPVSKILVFIACLIAGIAFGVFVWGNPGPKFVWEALFLSLAFGWGSFALP